MFFNKTKRMSNADFAKAAVVQSLEHMFQTQRHFSICDVEKQAKVLGVMFPQEERDRLGLLHCIYWNEMAPELRNEVCARVIEILSGEKVELSKNEIIDLFASTDRKQVGRKVYKLLKSGEDNE